MRGCWGGLEGASRDVGDTSSHPYTFTLLHSRGRNHIALKHTHKEPHSLLQPSLPHHPVTPVTRGLFSTNTRASSRGEVQELLLLTHLNPRRALAIADRSGRPAQTLAAASGLPTLPKALPKGWQHFVLSLALLAWGS